MTGNCNEQALFFFFKCVCLAYTIMCAYVHMCMQVYGHVWCTEVHPRHLPQLFSIFFFEIGSLTEPGTL